MTKRHRLMAQETLGDIVAMFSPGFMAQGRDLHPERERDWGGALAQPVGSIAQG